MKRPTIQGGRVLFAQSGLPTLQNRVYATAQQAKGCARGDVLLDQDASTGIVRNAAFDPGLLVYDENYQNEQACSGVFRQHLDQVATIVARHAAGRPILEIGCGKGWFLELLRGRGHRVTGVDPTYEGDAPDVVKAPFTESLGLSADVVVLLHVLEHIADPLDFLRHVARANGGKGSAYIEVPCFDWILGQRAWFDVFYEHVNYFRLPDWERIFGKVIEAGHLFGGQYQYVVADLSSIRDVPLPAATVEMPDDFLDSLERSVAVCAGAEGRRVAIWGAASKGVIFALRLQGCGIRIDFAVDINPAKQGGFMPVSGLRIVAPEEAFALLSPQDIVFVMNSNYLEEIRTMARNQYQFITVDR